MKRIEKYIWILIVLALAIISFIGATLIIAISLSGVLFLLSLYYLFFFYFSMLDFKLKDVINFSKYIEVGLLKSIFVFAFGLNYHLLLISLVFRIFCFPGTSQMHLIALVLGSILLIILFKKRHSYLFPKLIYRHTLLLILNIIAFVISELKYNHLIKLAFKPLEEYFK